MCCLFCLFVFHSCCFVILLLLCFCVCVQFCCFVARLVTAGSNFWLALNSSLGKKTEVSCLSRLSRCVSARERSHQVRSERNSVEQVETSIHLYTGRTRETGQAIGETYHQYFDSIRVNITEIISERE